MAVKKDSAIKSAKDLVGKTVAVNTLQNVRDTTIRETVRKDRGDTSKIKFAEMPFDQMPAAMEGGQVDAAWMGEPALTIAKGQGARVVASPFAGRFAFVASRTAAARHRLACGRSPTSATPARPPGDGVARVVDGAGPHLAVEPLGRGDPRATPPDRPSLNDSVAGCALRPT
nr:ABC transporter substrate-binding protein [Streptomyces sp. TLI_235]